MGMSPKPTLGFWHKMTLYTGESHGPNDALRAVEWGGEMAWQGNQTTSGDIYINRPYLFGGEKKEGGIRGTLSVRMGEPTQMPHPLLQSLVPGPWPAARGLVTTVFDGDVCALTPYVKACSKLWSRWLKGWRGDAVWQPGLCKIGEGMNAAHIFYQTLTDDDWGYGGTPAEVLDEANFQGVAQQLFDENFGLCLDWTRGVSIGDWFSTLCQHIGAQWGIRDDKVVVTLYRGNYDVNTLPLLDESNITRIDEWAEPQLDGSVNEVTVVGRDCMTGKDIARTYQNLASVQAQGRVVSEKRQLPGLWNLDLVGRVAARECNAKSMLPQRIKLSVKASAGPFVRGEVRALSWKRKQVQRMAVRVEEVDEGTLTDATVRLTVIQDVAGMAQTSYIADVGTVWEKPDTTPVALDPEYVYEATYRDLVGFMRPADLALVAPESGYLVALGARPPMTAYNFTLVARTGAAAYAEVGAGDFSPCGVLASGIGRIDTSILLNSHRGLTLVTVGEECIIGGTEHCRVTSINAGTGEIGIARGCVDTVPQLHGAGEVAWFPDTYQGYGFTEYLDGETVDAKLLTRTATGTLAEGSATTHSLVMDGRQARPYPPADVRVNGAWPAPASLSGSFTLAWSHRDRVLQGNQLIDWSVASIGPEPGTQYFARFHDAVTDALLHTTPPTSSDHVAVSFLHEGDVRMELVSVLGGLECRQVVTANFHYANSAITALLLHCDGVDGSTAFADATGKVVTAMGNAKIVAAQAQFGSGGLGCDGAGDYLSIPFSADFVPGAGDYTWQGWIAPAAIGAVRVILCNGEAAGSLTGLFVRVGASGTLEFYGYDSSNAITVSMVSAASTVTTTRRHWAVCKIGTGFALFYNGNRVATATASGTIFCDPERPLLIGRQQSVVARDWNGGQDEMMLTKGAALYSGATYVVPTGPFTV